MFGIFIGIMTTMHTEISVTRRKLLILDCNGLLWGAKTTKVPRQVVLSKDGVHYINHYVYYERQGLHQFLALCFEQFDVAIWTCAGMARTNVIW